MWTGFERCSIRNGVSQQDTLAEAEHISTIAGSMGSIGTTESQCADEALYDTDHTDLNSDFDEAELRRELLKDVSEIHVWVSTTVTNPLTRILTHTEMAALVRPVRSGGIRRNPRRGVPVGAPVARTASARSHEQT